MSKSNLSKSGSSAEASTISPESSETECSICMEKYVYPCQLECGHIFCFLCIKGFVSHSGKCALCRAAVSMDYLKTPNLVSMENEAIKIKARKHVWYYEGRNGWWEYDPRTNIELENEYKTDKKKKFQLLISGSIYVIDFENKLQYRLDDPNKKRRIKRDLKNLNTRKGVAGIFIASDNAESVNELNQDIPTETSILTSQISKINFNANNDSSK